MWQFILAHQFWTAVAAYWLFSAAVSSMPDPSEKSSSGYTWFWKFTHIIAGNLNNAFGGKVPGVARGAVTVLLGAVLLFTTGCPASNSDLRNVAVAAQDASIAVKTFQLAEVEAYSVQQKSIGNPAEWPISKQDHILVQGLLEDIANVGLTLDAGIRSAHTRADAIGCIDAALNELLRLQQQGTLHIKNQDTKAKFTIAVTGAQTALQSIRTMLKS